MNLKNELNFQAGLSSGKPVIFWQEKLSVRETENPANFNTKKARPKYMPPLAGKGQGQNLHKDANNRSDVKQQANKVGDSKMPPKKQASKKKAVGEEDKKRPASSGVVTMTQKQLNAILQTIGQLTNENAELQTKLIYNDENLQAAPPTRDKYSSERGTTDSGYFDETDKKPSREKFIGNPIAKQSSKVERNLPRHDANTVSTAANEGNVSKTTHTKPVPTTSEMVQPNPPASIPWSHLTKAEKLRMAQAKDQEANGQSNFPWMTNDSSKGKAKSDPAVAAQPSRQNYDPSSENKEAVAMLPLKSNAALKREQWEKEREMLKKLEKERHSTEERAMHSVPHNVINEPITIPPQSQPVILSPKMMSKAELLKIKWEKEKVEQQQHPVAVWNPFGRPGGGAPLKDRNGQLMADYHTRKDDVEDMQKSFTQSHNFDIQQQDNLTDNAVVPPAAIRSAFVIGGAAPDENRFAAAKEREKKQWLEDLEKQRNEKRLLIEKNKEILDTQGKYVASAPLNYLATDDMMKKFTENSTQPSSFLRGQNVPVDDVKKVELDEKRRRELEHQAFIRQQIEEKQRKKEEDLRKRQQEDMAEEMRMKKESEVMSLQIELEKLRNKAKEEAQEDRVNALKKAIEMAHRDAEKSKQLLKQQKLNQSGNYSTFNSNMQQTSTVQPALDTYSQSTAVHVQPTFVPGLQMTARGDEPHQQSVYVEDRILTPTKYHVTSRKDNQREFGVQAELDVSNTSRRIIRRNSSAGIMYDYEIDEKENVVKKETKNKVETHIKNVAIKKEKPNKVQQKVKQAWFYQKNKDGKSFVKASERDITVTDAIREKKMAQREQRMQQLLHLAEVNAPRIHTKAKQKEVTENEASHAATSTAKAKPFVAHGAKEIHLGKTKTIKPQVEEQNQRKSEHHDNQAASGDSKLKKTGNGQGPTATSRLETDYYVDQHSYENYARDNKLTNDKKVPIDGKGRTTNKYADKVPVAPLSQPESGRDFIPFHRTINILDPLKANEPLPESREPSAIQRAREAYLQEQHPHRFGIPLENHEDRKTRHHVNDPINNETSMSNNLQQEKILKQLADLKKGLLQKKHEVDRAPSDLK